MKKSFTSLFLLFVFAFFLNTVVAQNNATSFGPAPSDTKVSKNKDNTSSAANPLSRAFCYNGNVNFQLNKQSLANTTLTPVGSTVPFVFPGAAAWNYSNNRLYVIDQGSPFRLYTVDTLTGVRTFIANCTGVPHANFTGLTWDMVTGNMYGISSSITASQIFTVNITTGVCTPIGSPTAVVAGGIMVNAARNGTLFSVDIVADNLYKWNKTTGVPTLVGPIGFNANFGQDAHFDFSDGQYYWAAFNSSAGQAQLRIIDTTTGGSTLVGPYTGQVATLGIYTPLAPSVTINQAAGQPDPTATQPINFTAVFDQAVTGFVTGDVTLSGTASAGATATVTGSGATYNVAVTGMTVGGTIIVNIPAGVCTNSNGDLNTASTSTDNQVTYALLGNCTSVNNVPNQSVCTGSPTAPVNFTSPTPGTIYSWTNNTPAIGLAASGSGNIPSFIASNPGVTPLIATITVTPFLGLCAGPSISFTITVSPNPNIVIVADPGTTICEGDPTLLTVRIGSSGPVGPLYNQTGAQINGSPSQVFEPANAAFTSQSADDFVVPAGSLWTVTQITANGIGTGNPTSVNVFFYANSGSNLPGAAIASFNNITTFVRAGGNYTVTLPSSVNLAGGTYWMSMQVNMSFAAGGQWFWGNFGGAVINREYAWQNPGGGFGTPCTSWGYGGTGCNVGGGAANRNNIFSIVGSSITDGGPLPPGYTFLWSPALGLSSTTTNPVAASPMNTTTYTVNVTTPGNCTRTASILITVNKRPTVTTQPAASVRCVGNTATFTVVGTGTGLTYQWQESTAGCSGPWNNLTNGGAYSGVNTATLTINPVTGLMNGYGYRVILSGACAPINNANISNCALLTVNPNPVVAITPAVSCGGVAGISGTLLSVGSAPPPVPGSVTVNSGAISIPVPDNNPAGVNTNLTVAGIPANATITGVRATWTMPHTWNGDMVFVLRSPNGSILNLDYYLSATGGAGATTGFVNTTVSSAGVNALSTGTGTYTGTFRADANIAVVPPFGPTGPTGFTPTVSTWTPMYTPIPNGTWTLAMYDGGAIDLGTLTNWSITVEYTTPGGGGGPVLSYVWSPLTGLYTNPTATNPYLGTNTPIVYAAPTVLTVYTVRATDVATGCFTDATAIVNYTPPAPSVTPASVAMCLGDPAVKLKSSSSTAGSSTFSSGTVNIAIPDGPTIPPVPTSYPATTSNITVAGIPAGATITAVRARFNVTHPWVSDLVMALRAPNGSIVNLDALLNRTNQPGANFTNTVISSAATNPLGGAAPYTGTFADDAAGATFVAFGFTFPGGPTGYIPTTQQYTDLFTTGAVNGVWSLGIYDAGAPDAGTLNNWSLDIDYVVGVPATPATWSPLAGLFNDAAATIPYAGTPVDSVWARPAVTTTYSVTVQSLPVLSTFANPANIVINASGPGTPYPANLTVSGLPTSGVGVDSVRLTGISHTWGDDIDILLQSPTGQNVVLMSDVGGIVAVPNATYTFRDGAPAMNAGAANPTGTYRPTNNGAADNWPAPGPGAVTQATPTLASFGNTANVNGAWKLFVFDDVGGDAGNISGGFRIWFNVSIPACTSPARTVVVTVNTPTTVTTQPVNQTICTDKVATFTVVPGGTGPFTYQWQVSTNGGNPPWTNITNGGVYSGATTATLTITAPPVSMSGYQYRVIVTGAAPCSSATSFARILTVNPLPVVTITANRTSLLPGLTATLTSTVTPNAPAPNGGYTWLRNGVAVPGGTNATLIVDIDNLGDYTLRVTDINGCTNISNMITIKDSISKNCFIYPNPTSGQFQVRYYSVANNVLPRTLTIYDAKGDRVFTKMYTIGRPYDRMDVDMRAYSKGLYWVEIGDLNGRRLSMCRVVIQ